MSHQKTVWVELPMFWRLAVIVLSVVAAKFLARAIIPAEAHYLIRLFGGALIASFVGVLLLCFVVGPLARRRSKRPNG